MMKFQSTNGGFNVTSFSEAIMTSLCPDGGLLMPVNLPLLNSSLLQSWKHLTYPSLLTNFLQYIVDEMDPIYEYLQDIESEPFKSFDENVTQVKTLKAFSILELFHGPTLAFKDYAMFPLAFLVDKAIKIKAKGTEDKLIAKQNLLIGTTGDTGSSAIEASRNFSDTLNVFVLFPKDRVTEIQRLQMTTANTKNGYVIECSDSGDVIDDTIRSLCDDFEFFQKYNISGFNSLNCGRILCQIALHLYAYLQMAKNTSDTVNIAIPCGGWGNLISACLAYSMGLPIKIVLCTNENDLGHRLINEGIIEKQKDSHYSWSSAMDTSLPYNIERLLWIFSNHDSNFTKETMAKIKREEKVVIPDLVMRGIRSVVIDSISVTDDDTLETMSRFFDEENYYICPHTSTAVTYFYKRKNLDGINIALATASIEKFTEAAEKADIFRTSQNISLKAKLKGKPEIYSAMDLSEDAVMSLKKLIASHN